MATLLGARFAAASSARGRHLRFNWPLLAALALVLAGCMPVTAPLTEAGPADPRARVARVDYRSTIAPYTSLRPATPAPWRERNDSVAPQLKPDR
ncbi:MULTISPECIES: hypothetical protein [unclassified Bradyrhizobium]|uniref:hypothetical protein n=1 Tax=unclassified Bradyrhizobium TaxID=2631580 RepID=UPI002479A2FD|nr:MULTISPECIES: hypothetical protein [unclassified Bradyrhizobium]WGR73375.1 hypothetical protein MTX24_11415 [Bradyrhizobium sp. ISRA426]WGR78212.1 hypothetical protein MTX21_36385 [Bradyrhizobium sp. ISRA430]WGR88613.1 hypothetical protein MTX25_11425 [Bradyrhizobium sp. ISRA432]